MPGFSPELLSHPIPLKKVGDAWKLDLPVTITEDQADLVREGADLLKKMFLAMTEKVDAAPQLDLEALQKIQGEVTLQMMPEFMGLFGRASSLLATAPEPAKADEKKPEEKKTDEPKPEDQPTGPRSPRRVQP